MKMVCRLIVLTCLLISFISQGAVCYLHTDMLDTPIIETDESGHVISRSVYKKTVQPAHIGINFANDGAIYMARLTCTGGGGTSSDGAVIGGNGDEY